MKIVVKNIEKTCLQKDAYIKLIEKYFNDLECDVFISFDHRLKNYGLYTYDTEKRIHTIRMSPRVNGFSSQGTKLDINAEKYNLISTTIHELYHASQKERLGVSFWNREYGVRKDIKNPETAEFYSQCELETRIFENKNIISAVEFYDLSCI